MNDSPTPTQTPNPPEETPSGEPQASYVKLAMRNMVRKRGISIKHFLRSTIGVLALLIGLAYLTR